MEEKEIKITLKISLPDFIKRIEKRGYKLTKTLNQTDIYFDTKDWFLYRNIAALRLRQIDDKDSFLSFKKVFYLSKSKRHFIEEIEADFPITDFKIVKEIFNKLNLNFVRKAFTNRKKITEYLFNQGFFDEQVMPKIRTVYQKGNNEIVIDDVDKVGIIIELECKDHDPLLEVEKILDNSEWERNLEGTSYIWLKNIKGLNSHIDNLKRFTQEPMWNVWENEKEWYKSIDI